ASATTRARRSKARHGFSTTRWSTKPGTGATGFAPFCSSRSGAPSSPTRSGSWWARCSRRSTPTAGKRRPGQSRSRTCRLPTPRSARCASGLARGLELLDADARPLPEQVVEIEVARHVGTANHIPALRDLSALGFLRGAPVHHPGEQCARRTVAHVEQQGRLA